MRGKMSAPRSESSYPPEKEAGAETPSSDLNPMVNPTLSRNLGKWAEVYYTNPPEKREQAVVDLLRELQGAGPGNGNSLELPAETSQKSIDPPEPVAGAPSFCSPSACSQCGRNNAPEQAFCGYCGTALQPSTGRQEAPAVAELPRNHRGVLSPPQSPSSRMTETEASE